MCSVQEEGIPLKTNKSLAELKCVKCHGDAPVVVTRVNDAFCQDCFRVFAVHKFRSAIGKSKVIVPKEHVLVAYSGGPSSSALLHFMQEGIKEGKLRFAVSVVHIDEMCLMSGIPEEERLEKVETVSRLASQRGFPFYLTCINQVTNIGRCEEGSATSSPQLCHQVSSPADVGNILKSCEDDELGEILSSLSCNSAREEFLRVFRNRLLVEIARQWGFSKVVLGDTATLLSVRILTDIAKGKGSQVPFDTSIGDDRYEDVMMVRPLRELNLKEIQAYNRLQNVDSVSIPHMKDKWNNGNSIEQLTSSFIMGLQDSYPSTVPNIVRTSGKLSQGELQSQQAKCAVCQSGLDTDVGDASALRAVEASERLSRGCGVLQSKPSVAPSNDTDCSRLTVDEMKPAVCYGCRLMVKGMKDTVLPSYMTAGMKPGPQTGEGCSQTPEPTSGGQAIKG